MVRFCIYIYIESNFGSNFESNFGSSPGSSPCFVLCLVCLVLSSRMFWTILPQNIVFTEASLSKHRKPNRIKDRHFSG